MRISDWSSDVCSSDLRWTTFREYLDVVDSLPKGINYGANIGHSALRTFVMGEAAFERKSTDDELAMMRRELEDALAAGSLGFTTSRGEGHLTSDDRPVASRVARSEEHTSELQSLMRLSYAVFCLKTKKLTRY